VVGEEEEVLGCLFQSEAAHLQFVAHGEILLGEVYGKFMPLFAFPQHPHEQGLFCLFVRQQFLEVAQGAVLYFLLSFHALQVVCVTTVHANERVLDGHDLLLAETDSAVCEVGHLVEVSGDVAEAVFFGLGTDAVGFETASAFF
jgi:hypothetical protein